MLINERRVDIQVLRGIAVLLVIFYHAGLWPFSAGYLGVDCFFVISGFVIAQLVIQNHQLGRFRFGEFYARRARRLLPASIATVLVTIAVAPWFLGSQGMSGLGNQALGALTLTANHALRDQIGYFEAAADTKPLLHMWSLSVEEQFYLLLPAMLILVPSRRRVAVVGGAALASFIVWCWQSQHVPDDAFFLLPARAWELLLGTLFAVTSVWTALPRWLGWSAFAAILIVPTGVAGHLWAIPLVCLATAALLAAPLPFLSQKLCERLLMPVGNASYSLYLAHWPPIAFLNSAYHGEPPLEYRLAALIMGVVLGLLLFWFVEKPLRYSSALSGQRGLAIAALTLALSISFAGYTKLNAEHPELLALKAGGSGLDPVCDYRVRFEPLTECRTSSAPQVLVMGDSYAMQLVPGLVDTSLGGVQQATRSACAPFLDLFRIRATGSFNRKEGLECLEFNRSVIEFAGRVPSIKTVILSGDWGAYLKQERWSIVHGENLPDEADLPSLVRNSMAKTVKTLQAAGKKVVIFGAAPSDGKDYSDCLERQFLGLLSVGAPATCEIPRGEQDAFRGPIQDIFASVGAPFISLEDALCTGSTCRTTVDGVWLYRDNGHLSGARKLAQYMNWPNLIMSVAY